MSTGALGHTYEDGQVIVQQGDEGHCMFVVQQGRVEVVSGAGQAEVQLAILGEGEFFGEMAIFERETRAATVRALGQARVLTIDKKNFLRRIHEDPSLAFRLVESLSHRLRHTDAALFEARRTVGAPTKD